MKYTVRYAHLESINVTKGQSVNPKVPWEDASIIGKMGSSGISTAAHLHIDVIEGLSFKLWSLIDMYNGNKTPSKQQLDYFVSESDPTLFGVNPVITTEYDEPDYVDKYGKRHLGYDCVPVNRFNTDSNFYIYWNRKFAGRVLRTGYDNAYGYYVLVGYDTLDSKEWINNEVLEDKEFTTQYINGGTIHSFNNKSNVRTTYGQSDLYNGKIRYIKLHPDNFGIVINDTTTDRIGYTGVNGSFFNPNTRKPTSILEANNTVYCAFGNDGVYKQGTLISHKDDTFSLTKIKTVSEIDNVNYAIGGIELVRDGKITYDRNADNFAPPYNDVHRTTTQTSIGYTYDGYILLVRHWYSNRLETANHMKDLGCKYAIGLDGGGSTQYVVPDENQTRTSTRKVPVHFIATDLPI